MKLPLAVTAIFLALAAPAAADPFGALPFQPIAGRATCVRATGVPGEVSRWTKTGAELMRTDGAGLQPVTEVALGSAAVCPEVADQPDGAAVVAGSVVTAKGYELRVALRDPGAAFAAPVALAVMEHPYDLIGVAVAVSPRGDAVVVAATAAQGGKVEVRAFRRPAGGGFQPAQTLMSGGLQPLVSVAAGADAAGALTVAWTAATSTPNPSVTVITAPPGAGFGAPETIGNAEPFSTPGLAVAPDGRVLVAYVNEGVMVAERAPGAASFGAPVTVGPRELSQSVTVAVADGGGAVVAWSSQSGRIGEVRVASRATAGPFGAARDAAPGRGRGTSGGGEGLNQSIVLIVSAGSTPADSRGMRAVVAGSRFALAWDDQQGVFSSGTSDAATGELAGGPVARQPLGPGVRRIASFAPLALADGRAAVVWGDAADAAGSDRLHVAIAGAPDAPGSPAPAVSLVAGKRQRLYADQPLKLRIRCGAPCDVRAEMDGAQALPANAVASLPSAGEKELELRPLGEPLIGFGARFAKVTLTAVAPGGRDARTSHVEVPLTLRHSPPVPDLVGVTVRRSSKDLVVHWRTAAPARRVSFSVIAAGQSALVSPTAVVHGDGRRSFSARLRGGAAGIDVQILARGSYDRKAKTAIVKRPSGGWRA